MRNNWLHLGILIVVATATLWLGAELSKRITWILPYSAAVGALLIIVGLVIGWRRQHPDVSEGVDRGD
jgi:hypothetical protein